MPSSNLLILLNPGKMSRNYLLGIANSARRMGVGHCCIEIDQLRAAIQQNQSAGIQQFDNFLSRQRIGAVLGYTLNGCDLPGENAGGTFRTFFEARGIRHLLYWTDHPQWANEKQALLPGLQPAFRSANCFHFVKTQAHAMELNRILGWPNCHYAPLACDPDQIRPADPPERARPEFDVVAIYGGAPKLQDRITPFLNADDPDPRDIMQAYLPDIRAGLDALWQSEAPAPLRSELAALSEKLLQARLNNPLMACIRHISALSAECPAAMRWLTVNHQTYFRMTAQLYKLRSWLRHFMPAYLARHFRVGVFGGDWSALGCIKGQHGAGGWVDLKEIPHVLARGAVTLNLSAGYDEEGITAKPFEIAASGVAMLHNDAAGFEEFFEVRREAFTFTTPRQARQIVQELKDDPEKRLAVGIAARRRLEQDHSWDTRLSRILSSSANGGSFALPPASSIKIAA